ncbi:hypothetical protein [Thioalkalivibrio sp. K90mix]|uniref:hypothetical protein n=1 Tax=Thioalkalivibrio sp. (strain K90mix) TaxID=396595 RepID=UPI00030D3618|nr:hypothetical protein [Thioalkalivibrio sp. K90mix]
MTCLTVALGSATVAADPFTPPEVENDGPAVSVQAPTELEFRLDELEMMLREMREQMEAADERDAMDRDHVPAELKHLPGGSQLVGRAGVHAYYREPDTDRLIRVELERELDLPSVIPGAEAISSDDGGEA